MHLYMHSMYYADLMTHTENVYILGGIFNVRKHEMAQTFSSHKGEGDYSLCQNIKKEKIKITPNKLIQRKILLSCL